jgi:AraC-like DNA-binding protein
MSAENRNESSRPDLTDSLAPPSAISLSGCRISRPAGFGDGVEIVAVSPEPRIFPTHVSESLGICIKTGPSHDVQSDGRSLIYPADSICIRYPGCVWASGSASVGFISIDIATERLPQGIGYEPMLFLPRTSLPNILNLIWSVERSEEPLRQQEALAEIVVALQACSALDSDELHVATPRRLIVNRAREYLASRIQSNPSLDEVARAVEVNKFVLVRYFRRELGVTPHAWLVRLRVARARDLLARGVAPSEAADATGFADQAHLGRVFKRIVGLTPNEYARRRVW